jgi:hypothetical protein
MEEKEIQEWRDRLIKMFGIYHSDGQEYVTCPLCGINLDELANHMIKELDKARERGYQEGWEEGRKELLDSIIEGVTQLRDLVSMFYPMSPEIRAKRSGGIEAYNGLLEKLSKLTTK